MLKWRILLSSVNFLNVSIKCYILCKRIFYFVTYYEYSHRKRKWGSRGRASWWQTETKDKWQKFYTLSLLTSRNSNYSYIVFCLKIVKQTIL
jgi:hypothetical protein